MSGPLLMCLICEMKHICDSNQCTFRILMESEKEGRFSPVSNSKIRKMDPKSPIQFSPRKAPEASRTLVLDSDNEDEVFEFETPPPKIAAPVKTPEGAKVHIQRPPAGLFSSVKKPNSGISLDEFIAKISSENGQDLDTEIDQFINDKINSPTFVLPSSPLKEEDLVALGLSPLREGGSDPVKIEGRKLCFD